MGKIRVLQFPISANNGVKTYALNNWKFLDKSRFECDFAIVRPNLGFENEFIKEGAGVKYILSSADREPEQYIESIRKLLLGNYDVVHLHTSYWKRLLIEQIAMECKIPKVIVHSHNTQIDIADEEKRKEAEKIHWELREKFDISLATDFCACSWAAADWLFGPKIPKEKINILHNAIDVEKFVFNQAIRDKYRKLMELEDSFVIGHIGRFSAQKNHDFLINVFYEVNKELVNAKLMLVGEGPLENFVREKVERLGLTDKVSFLGQRQDIPQLLQAMDVFCLPSQFEGLPISLIEAQASGLMCITSIQVPEESTIVSTHMVRLPLVLGKWVTRLIEVAKTSFSRQFFLSEFVEQGYDLRHSFVDIEKLYCL